MHLLCVYVGFQVKNESACWDKTSLHNRTQGTQWRSRIPKNNNYHVMPFLGWHVYSGGRMTVNKARVHAPRSAAYAPHTKTRNVTSKYENNITVNKRPHAYRCSCTAFKSANTCTPLLIWQARFRGTHIEFKYLYWTLV